MTEPHISDIGFLRLPQILSMIPICKSEWYRGIQSGTFPQPIKLAKRVSLWRVEDIKKLIQTISQKEGEQ